MTVKLLTEHHLEFLSLKGSCTGSSESTLVKIPHCWKPHVTAQIYYNYTLLSRCLLTMIIYKILVPVQGLYFAISITLIKLFVYLDKNLWGCLVFISPPDLPIMLCLPPSSTVSSLLLLFLWSCDLFSPLESEKNWHHRILFIKKLGSQGSNLDI